MTLLVENNGKFTKYFIKIFKMFLRVSLVPKLSYYALTLSLIKCIKKYHYTLTHFAFPLSYTWLIVTTFFRRVFKEMNLSSIEKTSSQSRSGESPSPSQQRCEYCIVIYFIKSFLLLIIYRYIDPFID